MKTIRLIASLLLPILCLSSLPAQSTVEEQTENEINEAAGQEKVIKQLQLSDQHLAVGKAKEALEWAQEAERLAKKLNEHHLRAAALNRIGESYLLIGKKRRASGSFSASNSLLRDHGIPNKDLTLDNLKSLRKMAFDASRSGEVTRLDRQIRALQGAASEGVVIHKGTRKKDSPLPRMFKENSEEAKALEERLAQQEETIQRMSEEQAKSQLVLVKQQRLLDSLGYQSRMDSLALDNVNLELRRSQAQQQFNLILTAILILLALLAGFSYFRARRDARVLAEKNKVIQQEQERSEGLLLNILPALVADELKKHGQTQARYFDDVSVLFADFVGFSKIAEKLTPQQLVNDLDDCFKAFDEIIARYRLEKIKTIGDAYMCAGGLPDGGGSRIHEMIQAAREMQQWLHSWNMEREAKKRPLYQARIGIHRGPVVAGVVGSKKFAFDIWGDTVNIAARIEGAGEGSRINVSGQVYESVKNSFECNYRGKIPVKNKGEIDMYFVEP